MPKSPVITFSITTLDCMANQMLSLTPSLQVAEGLTEPDLEPGPEFIAGCRIMPNDRKRRVYGH